MKVETFNTTDSDSAASTVTIDDAEYLSAENSPDDAMDLLADLVDTDEEFALGLYYSLPDICLVDFEYQLTEPLCPSMSSDQDYHSRYFSLDPPSVSGLLLIPKHTLQIPKIECVSLNQTEPETAHSFAFLGSHNLRILQSCNGLFLCFSPSSQLYSLYNMSTQQLEDLPGSPYMDGQFALTLAFDPFFLPHFKVICVKKLDRIEGPLYQISIYSAESRLWSLSGDPFTAPDDDIDFNDVVFCKGAIHWMRCTSKGLYFDVEDEILKEMPKPPLKEGFSLVSCEYFGESQGRLYYAVASAEMPYLELFEMKDDYSGWILRMQIDLKALAMEFPIVARRFNDKHPFFPRYECDVLSVVQSQNDEDVEVVLSIPGEVIAYNHKKKSTKTLCHLSLRPDDRAVWYRVYSAYQCFELPSF